MRRILEDLYHGNLTASGQTFRRGTKYARALARVAETEDALGRKLAPEDHPLLAEYAMATTTRTRETVTEYAALPKGERDTIKDVGGFVGGYLKDGKRNNASVVNRCMLCLDADNADPGLMDDLDMTFINAYALYSTHSHTPEKMRLRLIIPLTRTVTTDEYAAVSRRVADDLGLLRFDPTTFEPARLMYWPSTPEDGEFFFHCEDAPFLDPDEVLKTYADWRDASLGWLLPRGRLHHPHDSRRTQRST